MLPQFLREIKCGKFCTSLYSPHFHIISPPTQGCSKSHGHTWVQSGQASAQLENGDLQQQPHSWPPAHEETKFKPTLADSRAHVLFSSSSRRGQPAGSVSCPCHALCHVVMEGFLFPPLPPLTLFPFRPLPSPGLGLGGRHQVIDGSQQWWRRD